MLLGNNAFGVASVGLYGSLPDVFGLAFKSHRDTRSVATEGGFPDLWESRGTSLRGDSGGRVFSVGRYEL